MDGLWKRLLPYKYSNHYTMSKLTIFLTIFLMLGIWCHGQTATKKKKHTGNYAVTGGLVLLAGAADGLNQVICHKYPSFQKAFPRARVQWWAQERSWSNKYKNGDPAQGRRFPGSKTWLVFTTDGYHATRFSEHLLISGAIAVKISGGVKKKWYWYALEMVGYWMVHRVGFSAVYERF